MTAPTRWSAEREVDAATDPLSEFDPTRMLAEMLEALSFYDADEFQEKARSLAEWIREGGESPVAEDGPWLRAVLAEVTRV